MGKKFPKTKLTTVKRRRGRAPAKEPRRRRPPLTTRTDSSPAKLGKEAAEKHLYEFGPVYREQKPEYWNHKWQGERDPKTGILTLFRPNDLFENICIGLEDESAEGYGHALNWLVQMFPGGDAHTWPKMLLRNCYRKIFGKEPREGVHILYIRDAMYSELSRRKIEHHVSDPRWRKYKLYRTWCKLLSKIRRKIGFLQTGQFSKLDHTYRQIMRDALWWYDEVTRKGANEMAKKGKKVKKGGGGKETMHESIIAVGRKKKGVVSFNWIREQVTARRIKLGIVAKKNADKVYPQHDLRRLCEAGEVTKVASGKYSFDGSKAPAKFKKASLKKDKKTAKKSSKKSSKKASKKSPKKKSKKHPRK